MKLKSGFFLLEFLVYFSLFSLVSVLLMQFIVTKTIWLSEFTSKQQKQMQLYSALDVFERELKKAPDAKKEWIIKSDSIIWHDVNEKCDIGWCVQNNAFYKIKGTFDIKEEVWKQSHRFLLSDWVNNVTFVVHEKKIGKKERVDAVTCTIRSGNRSILKYISMDNRVIS